MSNSISFPSPVYRYDPIAEIMITERRNTSTGAVITQAPSPATIREADIAALAGGPDPSPAAGSTSRSQAGDSSASAAESKASAGNKGPVVADNAMAGPQENNLQLLPPNTLSIIA